MTLLTMTQKEADLIVVFGIIAVLTLAAISGEAQRFAGTEQFPPHALAFMKGQEVIDLTIENLPDSHIYEFRLSRSLCDLKGVPPPEISTFTTSPASSELGFYRSSPRRGKSWGKIGKTGRFLVTALLAIPGVTGVRLRESDFQMRIGYAFGWNSIEPQAVKALREILQFGKTVAVPAQPESSAPEGITVVSTFSSIDKRMGEFDLRQQVCTHPYLRISKKDDFSANRKELKRADALEALITTRLLEIEGVDSVLLDYYSVLVALGRGYDVSWTQEKQSEVMGALKRAIADYNSSQKGK